MLFQRHTARIRKKRGRAGVRRFRATLLIEQSVAHIRHREMVSGAVAAAGALALSPGRFLDLVRRGLAKMRQRDM